MGGKRSRRAEDDWVLIDTENDANSDFGVLVEDPFLSVGFEDDEFPVNYVAKYNKDFPPLPRTPSPVGGAWGGLSGAPRMKRAGASAVSTAQSACRSSSSVSSDVLSEFISAELQRYREYEAANPFDEDFGAYDWLDPKLVNYRAGNGGKLHKKAKKGATGAPKLVLRPPRFA